MCRLRLLIKFVWGRNTFRLLYDDLTIIYVSGFLRDLTTLLVDNLWYGKKKALTTFSVYRENWFIFWYFSGLLSKSLVWSEVLGHLTGLAAPNSTYCVRSKHLDQAADLSVYPRSPGQGSVWSAVYRETRTDSPCCYNLGCRLCCSTFMQNRKASHLWPVSHLLILSSHTYSASSPSFTVLHLTQRCERVTADGGIRRLQCCSCAAGGPHRRTVPLWGSDQEAVISARMPYLMSHSWVACRVTWCTDSSWPTDGLGQVGMWWM